MQQKVQNSKASSSDFLLKLQEKVGAKSKNGYFRLFLNFAPNGCTTPQSAAPAARPAPSDAIDLLQTAQVCSLDTIRGILV